MKTSRKSQCALAVLLFALLLNKVHAKEQILTVHLISYENLLALEYRADSVIGPYCCCEGATCSSDLSSAPQNCPRGACDLVFSVCVNVSEPIVNPAFLTGDCHQSLFQMNSPNRFNFSVGGGVTFSGNFGSPVFLFNLGSNSRYQDTLLTVAIHDFRDGQFWDFVDIVELTFQDRASSTPAVTYNGIYGIANITLSYSFLNIDEDLISSSIETRSPTVTRIPTVSGTSTVSRMPADSTGTSSVSETPAVSGALTASRRPADSSGTSTVSETQLAVLGTPTVSGRLTVSGTPTVLGTSTVSGTPTLSEETTSIPVDRSGTNFNGVTNAVIESSTPLPTGVETASSAVWLPVSLVTLSVAAAILFGIVIAIIIAMSVIKRKRKRDDLEISARERQLGSNMYLEVDNEVYIPSAELEKEEQEKAEFEKEDLEKLEIEYNTYTKVENDQQPLNTTVDNEKDFYNYYQDHI